LYDSHISGMAAPALFQKRREVLIIDPVRNSRILHLTDTISVGVR